MENKIYKYVGIIVIAFFVITLVIRLFHLNTQIIEGLEMPGDIGGIKNKIGELKNKRKINKDEKSTSHLESILEKVLKNREVEETIMKPILENKDTVEDILVDYDEGINDSMLYYLLDMIGGQNSRDSKESQKIIKSIEDMFTIKKAINLSIEHLSGDVSSKVSSTATNISSGIFS